MAHDEYGRQNCATDWPRCRFTQWVSVLLYYIIIWIIIVKNTMRRRILSCTVYNISAAVTGKSVDFFFLLFRYLPFFLHIMYAERLHNELRDRSRVEIQYKTLVKLDPVPWILDVYAPPQNTERVTKLAKMWKKKSIIILVNILKYEVQRWYLLENRYHVFPVRVQY